MCKIFCNFAVDYYDFVYSVLQILNYPQRMMTIETSEILRRRDMRDVFTFTIDPADAKDFDDALSFLQLEDGSYQIGVHIADVSFYVRPNTKTDDDAYQRGTSL